MVMLIRKRRPSCRRCLVSGFAQAAPAEYRASAAHAPARARDGESTRPVYFGKAGGLVETSVYERDALPAGFEGAGPAVIEEYGSTTLVLAGRSL